MRIVTLTITAISLIPMAAFAADEFATPPSRLRRCLPKPCPPTRQPP